MYFSCRSRKEQYYLSLAENDTLLQTIDFLLQVCQKSAGVGTVHLGVVELEGDGKIVSEQLLLIPAPDQKRIVENPAVHTHGAVDLGIHDGGGADDHAALGQIPVLAAVRNLPGIGEIVLVEAIQVF